MNQTLSFAGAILILIGYAGQQFGWLRSHAATYNLVNAAGSLILGAIALRPFQLGFVMLEFIWAGISLWALARCLGRKPAA
ncbi:MAG TPA: hypothetical protein VLT16_11760 [Candidatus Limnocylindrales bacterium]|nr:hypothetical protein [Candidatus Limnocylindrales bacterium]